MSKLDVPNIAVTKVEADEQWQLRVDLAASHRLAVIHGFSEGIYNHFTAVSGAEQDGFLCLPFGKHWSEAAASDILEVGWDGGVRKGTGYVESSAYCIHAPIHQARPDAACVLHTHMPFASALTRLEDPRLKEIGQTEASYSQDIAYDDVYAGFARSPDEGWRMAEVLGKKNILFMAHHGVMVLGKSIAEAYDRLYYLERACQVQLYAMWTGAPLKYIPPEVLAKTRSQFGTIATYGGRQHYELHFDALKRSLIGPQKRFDE